jgi:hypothetical protein
VVADSNFFYKKNLYFVFSSSKKKNIFFVVADSNFFNKKNLYFCLFLFQKKGLYSLWLPI